MTNSEAYQIILSVLHEYIKTTTNPTIDGFTLFLLRKQASDLQQQREVIRNTILQQADEFSKQKGVKQ